MCASLGKAERSLTSAFANLSDKAAERLWLRPMGPFAGTAAAAAAERGLALPLAGSDLAFSLIEVLARGTDGITQVVATLAELQAWSAERGGAVADRVAAQLAALTGARPSWAGLSFARPLLMGIVNVTPDSFSDGGDFREHHRAIAQARALLEEGADIIDVGGESTRPGAVPVSVEEEWRRVEPVIRALADAGAILSIDTRHARVMAAALAAGARIVNDVSALTGEPESIRIVARSRAPVVLMHMQNDPRTMQRAPSYTLASLDIAEYLEDRIAACVAGGIAPDRIVVDPGIGFGKRADHNLEIIERLSLLHALGRPVLLGLSRKGIVGGSDNTLQPKERLPGSLAGALAGVAQGVQILRVHDIAETRQAVGIWRAATARRDAME